MPPALDLRLPTRLAKWMPYWGIAVLWLLAGAAWGQVVPADSATISKDSLQRTLYQLERGRARRADSVKAQQHAVYERANRLKKSKVGDLLYRLVFRDPPNPLKVETGKKKGQNFDRKYGRYNNRIIRRIIIKPLDVFGPKVFDTLTVTHTIVGRLGNAVHNTTRRRVIANQLTFKAGDRFSSVLISNNERVLRQTAYLLDARIIPLSAGSRDSVDVLIITQDIFSLSGGLSIGGLDNLAPEVTDINFLGFNHTASIKYEYIGTRKPQNNYRAYYFIPYIIPRSFISAEGLVYWYWNQHTLRARVFKDFLFTTTRNAGSLEINQTEANRDLLLSDTARNLRIGQRLVDGWLGRAFPVHIGNAAEDDRIRVILAGRIQNYYYTKRPYISADSNQIFRDRTLTLASIGYVDRDYFRDIMINGYGRTEDVPYGLAVSATVGVESNANFMRQYVGGRYAQSRFLGKMGYANFIVDAGTYINYTRPEQGALRGLLSYFTPLISLSHGVYNRNFIRAKYIRGFNRFGNEYLDISNRNGLQGVGAPILGLGTKSLTLNFESVLFFDLDVLAFKVAPFATVDLGWIADKEPLLNRTPYLGLGLGVRLFNERLSISTFQLRLNYYPNITDLSTPYRYNFARGPQLGLYDFQLNAPEVVGLVSP